MMDDKLPAYTYIFMGSMSSLIHVFWEDIGYILLINLVILILFFLFFLFNKKVAKITVLIVFILYWFGIGILFYGATA